MNKENNEQPIYKIDNKYRKILIAAKRSKQLQKGARPRVTINAKSTRIALEEIDRGLVEFHIEEVPEPGVEN